MNKRALFIDRDGTIIHEPPTDFQVDSLEKLEFLPYAISSLARLSALDYEMVMVTNQDGLGTASFPAEDFWTAQNKMITTLRGEGVLFDDILIDDSFEEDNSPNRKPRTGMMGKYLSGDYDLAGSYVLGDRLTDIELAQNLGAQGILLQPRERGEELLATRPELAESCVLICDSWRDIYEFIRLGDRTATIERTTRETQISLHLDLDGGGESSISTPYGFLDHMIDQIVHHAGVTINLEVQGDTHVDEHHTVEDLAIVLGEAIRTALGDKRGIERYGFALPMDECEAFVVMDLGGRIDFAWNVEFTRDMVGDIPTEMFEHFFKSLSQAGLLNLHITAKGENNHHLIEGVFKAFARTLRSAVKRDVLNCKLPTSKGII
ncbi:MAG: bifunctional histidinol-phosphatase/imidazoleglycerol-phosphate dehydratase HisB [Rikenellaceae bacterium]